MSRVLAVLVLCVGLLAARLGDAHEFRPALLRLSERPGPDGGASGSFDLRLVTPKVGPTGLIAEGELRPRVPSHCELRPGLLDCGETGLVGELGVDGLERHDIDVLVEIRFVDGTRLTGVLGPDEPSMSVAAGAIERRGSVFAEYVRLGVEHILIGIDHLLFVLGLVLLVRGTPPSQGGSRALGGGEAKKTALLWTITAFTLAHSITLAAATLEIIALPGPPVEAVIALSILLLARELALGTDDPTQRDTWTWRFPWLVAFGFGLLHGFGFSGALREVGLPPDRVPEALLAFNVGVELGQLAVVGALLLSFAALRRVAARMHPGASAERSIRIIRLAPIWAMGALAFAWTLERVLGFWP
jgi:hydrogenase/urease accessory protein HupE